jgi:hypothetical protein
MQFHILVRVAGIAVFAGELAAAVGINGPGERHTLGGAVVQNGTDRQSEILDVVAVANMLAFGGQSGYSYQSGRGRHGVPAGFALHGIEKGQGRHGLEAREKPEQLRLLFAYDDNRPGPFCQPKEKSR